MDNLSASGQVVLRFLCTEATPSSLAYIAHRLSSTNELVESALLELESWGLAQSTKSRGGPECWAPSDDGRARYRPYPGRRVHPEDHPEAYYSPTQGYIVRGHTRTMIDQPDPLVRANDRRVVHELPEDAVKLVPETRSTT